MLAMQHGVRAAQQTGNTSECFDYQHPLMLAPQLQSTRFHNSGGNAIQVDQLVAELAFAACHIQHSTTAAQQLTPKGVNQKSANRKEI